MKITREEFIEKYGDVEVTFSSYYKYTFTYTGTLEDGSIIAVSVGGNPDDIYRFEVTAGVRETIRNVDPSSGVVSLDGVAVESFYDYY